MNFFIKILSVSLVVLSIAIISPNLIVVQTSAQDSITNTDGMSDYDIYDANPQSKIIQEELDAAITTKNAILKQYEDAQSKVQSAEVDVKNTEETDINNLSYAEMALDDAKSDLNKIQKQLDQANWNLASKELVKNEALLTGTASPEERAKILADIEKNKQTLTDLGETIAGNNAPKTVPQTTIVPFYEQSGYKAEPEGYIPLEPGFWKSAEVSMGYLGNAIPTNSLGDFLKKVFSFGIAIAVALSVIMISVGGIQYMTTDSWNKKEEGRERIQNAFKGLALALVSWLILYTINPNLVDFSNNRIVTPTVNKTSK